MLKVVGASWQKTRWTSYMLGAVFLLAIVAIFFFSDPTYTNDGKYAATVFWSERYGFQLKFWGQGNDPQNIKPGAARAYYRPDMKQNGWAALEIETQAAYPDWIQAHAAGLLEGSLCWQMIYWHYVNTLEYYCHGREDFCTFVQNYLRESSNYTRQIAKEKDSTDPFWHQVNLFYWQLDGLHVGWNYGVKRSGKSKEIGIDEIDFLWLNAVSDIRDLEVKFNMTKIRRVPDPVPFTLIKLLPNNDEKFLVSHSSAGYYTELLRMQKKYTFGFHQTVWNESNLVPGQSLQFTSYPAALSSQDDFYHVQGFDDFVVTGAQIKNHNKTNWNLTDIKQVMLAPRVLAANRLARTPQDWTRWMSWSNSGTGNKQWTIINPKQGPLELMELWVLEQLPGSSIARNETATLHEQNYWIFYSSPIYHEAISEARTYKGDVFSIMERILKEGQEKVTDFDSLKSLLRGPNITFLGRSDVQHQTLRKHHHHNHSHLNLPITVAIFGRSELHNEVITSEEKRSEKKLLLIEKLRQTVRDRSGSEEDESKNDLDDSSSSDEDDVVTSYLSGNLDLVVSSLHHNIRSFAGPPWDGKIPPFRWSTSGHEDVAHIGHIDLWNFKEVEISWSWW